MAKWQSGSALAVALYCLIGTPFSVRADETGEDAETAGTHQVSSLTKEQYESEAISLATWKSKVQGTQMGDNLISRLTTLNANLVRNSRDTNSLYNRGYLYGTVGCTKAAIQDLSKAIQIDPTAAHLYCERGICYMDLEEYDKATSDLSKAIRLNPVSGDARLARGRMYLILERPLDALADLQAASDSSAEYAPALPGELPANFYHAPEYYLGICYELLGRSDEAKSCYRNAAKEVTGADSGYLHRYADRPSDAGEKAKASPNG